MESIYIIQMHKEKADYLHDMFNRSHIHMILFRGNLQQKLHNTPMLTVLTR